MFLEIFNWLDGKILAGYQLIVNLSNKITGRGEEHLRLAKLSRWTDILCFMISLVWYQRLACQWGIPKEQTVLVSSPNDVVIFLWPMLCLTCASLAIQSSHRAGTMLAANLFAFDWRRYCLTINLILLSMVLAGHYTLSITKHLILAVPGQASIYFFCILSPHYFLSCLAPPRQKSLFAKLKEVLTPEPTQQALPVAVTYRSTTA